MKYSLSNFLRNSVLNKLLIIVLPIFLFLAGSAFAADTVKVRFAWKIKGEYAPLYVALEKGYFEKQGLEITLGEGAGAQAALAGVLQGKEDIFIGPGVFGLSAIQKGIPVKLIALYHPSAPIVLLSHPDNPVNVPADLVGKKVATSVGETGTAYLNTLCALNNVDCGKVDRVMMDQSARTGMFIQRSVDVISAYTTNDLPLLRAASGEDFVLLDLTKYGLTVPGMAVVASKQSITDNPDVLRRFLIAVNEGYEATIADPEAAALAISKHWSNAPKIELIEEQVRKSIEVTPRVEGKAIGYISQDVIEFTLNLIKEYENEPDILPIENFYTNELLLVQ